MTIEIRLTQGQTTTIDDADADLAQKRWYFMRVGYAARSEKRNGIKSMFYLHRVILERILDRPLCDGEYTDHINADKLDNRRANIRIATATQSIHNTRAHLRRRNKTTHHKGVYYNQRRKTWNARIMNSYQVKHIGAFQSAEAAARAYDYWAIKLHLDFASLNFPHEHDQTIAWGDAFFNQPQEAKQFCNNTSGYRGVYRFQNKWGAHIGHNKKNIYLGYFATPEEAAKAYDKAAREMKGAQAKVNFPVE
jgi:AP2 domain-containing protein